MNWMTKDKMHSVDVGHLLIGVLRVHEKMAWMLRAFIVENKD